MEDHFYTCEDVAKILNSKVSTVRTHCKEGKIPAIKVGRGYRISKKDLERWMRSKKEYELIDEKTGKTDEKYKILFESASDAIMICDIAGHITLVNSQFSKLLGYSKQEAENIHFSKIIHPDDLAKTAESLMTTIAGEPVKKNLDIKLIAKSGEILFVSVNTNAIYEDGEIKGFQAIIRNFTEEKKAENKILLLAGMLEQTADAFVGIDGNRRIIYVNPATLKMFGYKHEQMIGKDIALLHGSKRVEVEKAEITETVKRNGVWIGEILNKRKNGERFWCWLTVNKIDDKEGNLIAYTAVIREINKKV